MMEMEEFMKKTNCVVFNYPKDADAKFQEHFDKYALSKEFTTGYFIISNKIENISLAFSLIKKSIEEMMDKTIDLLIERSPGKLGIIDEEQIIEIIKMLYKKGKKEKINKAPLNFYQKYLPLINNAIYPTLLGEYHSDPIHTIILFVSFNKEMQTPDENKLRLYFQSIYVPIIKKKLFEKGEK